MKILEMDSQVGDPCGKIPDGDPGYEHVNLRMRRSHPVFNGLNSAFLLVGQQLTHWMVWVTLFEENPEYHPN
jgi:hypothetical protein